MKRIAIVYAESKPHVPALLAELRGWIDERGWEATFYGSRLHDPTAIAGATVAMFYVGLLAERKAKNGTLFQGLTA